VTDQTDPARLLLPQIIGDMDSEEIADYCEATGLSADPAIKALVRKLYEFEYGPKGQLQHFHAQTQPLLDQLEELRNMVRVRPGPKPKYLPLILRLLRVIGPLERKELARRVMRMHPDAGEGAVYRAIAKAVKDRMILNLHNVLHPRT